MGRKVRTRFVWGVTCLAALVVLPASAATTSVAVQNFSFTPSAPAALTLGDTVTWSFSQGMHTTTSDQGFWNSGVESAGDSFSMTKVFQNAGSYPYHCSIHAAVMKGVIRVPVGVTGSAGSGWTVRWSTLTSTPANRTFDVQLKKPGSTTWQSFRANTSQRKAAFDPARSGTYRFRARTDNVDNGRSSDWSPARSLSVP